MRIGNVWGQMRAAATAAVVILCAHLDTVFGAEVAHAVRIDGDTAASGPGVGDDAVGLAALSAAGSALLGREGCRCGCLRRSARRASGTCAASPRRSTHRPVAGRARFVAVEGQLPGPRVDDRGGIGPATCSRCAARAGTRGKRPRRRAPCTRSAELVAVHRGDAPPPSGTSVNVGRIGGGEGINMRAREAWFELDLRADDPDALAALARDVERLLGRIDPTRSRSTETRSATGRPVASTRSTPLVRAARRRSREVGRGPPRSRDQHRCERRPCAWHPRDRRGRDDGDRASTRPQEWIDTAPIADGVRALARTVERFEELRAMTGLRSGVVLQGAYPPGEFRPMVERIDALGYSTTSG